MIDYLTEKLKEVSPYIVGGATGAVIHRLRNKMSHADFIKTLLISVFVSLCVGSVLQDYFNIQSEKVIYSACGIAGVFSNDILDELRQIIRLCSNFFRHKIGLHDKNNTDE